MNPPARSAESLDAVRRQEDHNWRDRVALIANADNPEPHWAPSLAGSEPLGLLPVQVAGEQQFALRQDEQGWALWPPMATSAFGRLPLRIDFVHDARFRTPLTLREPLARAAGIKAGLRPPIIDLTAGLGRDAWALASIGCPVCAFERHPLIHFLLADALARARQHPAAAAVADRIELYAGSAQTHHKTQLVAGSETVWLFDPMFPPRQKSAEVKKEMRIFAALIGADTDAESVLTWARTQPGARWVMKRPHHAVLADSHAPDWSVESARIRFDVFLPRRGAA